MPKTDYDAIDLAEIACAELDAIINSHIEKLIAQPAATHDHTTGIIKGLQTARKRISDLGRRFRMGDRLDGDDASSLPQLI